MKRTATLRKITLVVSVHKKKTEIVINDCPGELLYFFKQLSQVQWVMFIFRRAQKSRFVKMRQLSWSKKIRYLWKTSVHQKNIWHEIFKVNFVNFPFLISAEWKPNEIKSLFFKSILVKKQQQTTKMAELKKNGSYISPLPVTSINRSLYPSANYSLFLMNFTVSLHITPYDAHKSIICIILRCIYTNLY